MEKRVVNFFKKGLWVALCLLVLRYHIVSFKTIYDFVGACGEVISATLILMGFYCGFLWKYNPLEKVPNLAGKYSGIIEYNFEGSDGQKETNVEIKQTLLTISVRMTTNEITSRTITGNLIEENDEYVLYYTYITNPKGKHSEKNPMQYGTCRLQLDDKGNLIGTYWTSRKTIGDITLNRLNL